MIYPQCKSSLISLGLLLAVSSAHAAYAMVTWPAGWEVEPLPATTATEGQPSVQMRQRAVKNDQNGNPVMVMELTQTRLQPGHEVNVQSVLLEMRKAIQINFARDGFQSVCSKVHEGTLSALPTLETTCSITQNGGHVMTQTLVAAATKDTAWSLSYAGSADGYAATKDEVQHIRDSLQLVVEQ
ncbi:MULTISPECIES: DUF4946 domain-containing protein [unclassified Pseudomonas]|uniref:DUF4946 domain-containing protein n=1 Tax=unclassified Pseudomonas TaxID=196821 RepID=UPI002AC9D5D2|nr:MULTISPECIES: DUF4946 domain-containing protein [unclassified Pseudomonas]MEB0040667.1 DUF4946 domain-containing protein [Pseudomonas sp. MH10]MEB0076140.1 DUF4946 domain-containing protein [Pseudomonas sp. MH10out]MEB0090635.1 DUF4946 domain-containing protein [Pseudomonas sp. CCI4.2]MEB0100060.1 DUF4946 domain-containing protein [Pseudomonas sp. CCI3.2]MEB0119665.1 DUF4946 domain-containing protein [Pseudomonas sp. CCI1.2]